jgi:4,5-DOPA dioxygenase extradiol
MQPVLFIGHGSPMNAIEANTFTKSLVLLGKTLIKPSSVLIISAHWLTRGTSVTYTNDTLETIHDFGGFPAELFNKQYNVKGSISLAENISKLLKPQVINFDQNRGLDHGAWSILTHLFPLADIPIVQISIDITKPPRYHFELGQKLSELANQNVLIVASGNIIHSFEHLDLTNDAKPRQWALEFQANFIEKLKSKDWNSLIDFQNLTHFEKAINTAEHYFPLFYALGSAKKDCEIEILSQEISLGSMSMLSFKLY